MDDCQALTLHKAANKLLQAHNCTTKPYKQVSETQNRKTLSYNISKPIRNEKAYSHIYP